MGPVPCVWLAAAHRQAAASAPLRWFNPDRRLVATDYVQLPQRPDERRGEHWMVDTAPTTYARHACEQDRKVLLR